MDLCHDPPPAEQSGDQALEVENLRLKVVWEVAVEAERLLRCHCRPRGDRGHRLSRAAAPRSTQRRLSRSRPAKHVHPLNFPVALGPREEAEPPQEERSPLQEAVAAEVPWGGTS